MSSSSMEDSTGEAKAALARLETALDALEAAVDRANSGAAEKTLRDERQALISRVRELETKSRDDVRLRGEAADAVRAALQDLRAIEAQGGGANG